MRSFDIIGAPFNRLGHLKTNRNTVNPIRKSDKNKWNGLTEWINIRNKKWDADINDSGDVKVSNKISKLLKNKNDIKALQEYTRILKLKINSSIKNNRIPITIGGDHSISISTISSIIENYSIKNNEKVAIIWIDAHADCNDSLNSNLHGKPLAILMNKFEAWKLTDDEILSPKDIIYIGLRDIMPNELKIIEDNDITNFSIDKIDELGIKTVYKAIENKISDYDRIYISLDYDSLDGSIFNHCSTPNIGGLNPREILYLIDKFTNNTKFIGLDICEYLPHLDKNKISKELIVKIIDTAFGYRL